MIFSIAAAAMLVSTGEWAHARVYRRLGPPEAWRPIPHARTVCYAFGIAVAIALNASDVATLRNLLARFRGQLLVSGAGAVAYGGPVELLLGVAARHLGLLDDAVTSSKRPAESAPPPAPPAITWRPGANSPPGLRDGAGKATSRGRENLLRT